MDTSELVAGRFHLGNEILITGIGGPAGRSALTYFKGKGATVTGTDVSEVDIKADTFHLVPMDADPAFVPALLGIIKRTFLKKAGGRVPVARSSSLTASQPYY